MMLRPGNALERRVVRILACALLAMTATACGDDEPDAGDGVDDAVTATSQDEEPSTAPASSGDPVADATTFWEAVVAGDRATALGFVGPPPAGEEPLKLFGRAETLERQFDWYEAVGWQWTLEGCGPVEGDPDVARCDATAKNAWSEAMGVDPVTGTFTFLFDDDGFLTIPTDSFGMRWVGRVFRPFEVWVSENHPEDAEVMWGDGEIDEVVLELYEVNTERFVAAQQGT